MTQGLYMGGRALDQGAAAALEGMLPGSERAEPEGESGAVVPLKPARSAVTRDSIATADGPVENSPASEPGSGKVCVVGPWDSNPQPARPVYEHGCGGSCGRKEGFCPKRRRLNPEVGEAKSQAGRRVIGLPAELVQLLREHRSAQDVQRVNARQLWQEGGWVFTSAVGKPLSLNSDYREWKALLKAAGVPDGRLHDARHTAATVFWSSVCRSGQ